MKSSGAAYLEGLLILRALHIGVNWHTDVEGDGWVAAKDYLPILISAFAFLISLGSFVLSVNSSKRQSFEEQRVLRSSLNDVISKIFAARIDQAKYVQMNPNWMNNDLSIAVNNVYTS
jgi:hypothetical protein